MTLLTDFLILKEKKLKLAQQYEEEENFEMAYIGLWVIVEHSAKVIELDKKNKKLKQSIKEWHQYFEEESTAEKTKPKPLKTQDFQIDINKISIPEITLIKKSLGSDIPAINKLLNTSKEGSTKYRKKRNNIVHNAESIKNLNTYQDYKETALAAIEELEVKLREMSNG